jgi:hypothetical protein
MKVSAQRAGCQTRRILRPEGEALLIARRYLKKRSAAGFGVTVVDTRCWERLLARVLRGLVEDRPSTVRVLRLD